MPNPTSCANCNALKTNTLYFLIIFFLTLQFPKVRLEISAASYLEASDPEISGFKRKKLIRRILRIK